jgi:acyl-CoA thioesterase-1
MGLLNTLFKPALLIIMLTLFASTSANPKILVWGDSLSAAYGIPKDKGWVNLMRQELGDNIEVTNGSISGETTRGGLTRLPRALKKNTPDFLILELGANDGLRGLPPSTTKNNLTKIIEKAQKADTKVILLGMKIPPNYGIAYSNKFESIFKELAEQYELPFIPFFLEKIVIDRNLVQKDQLHPTAEAQSLILKAILPLIIQELGK